MRTISTLFLVACVLVPFTALAQTPIPDQVTFAKAKVIAVISQEIKPIAGTSATSLDQELKFQLLDGPQAGQTLTVENNYVELHVGDVAYLQHTQSSLDGTDFWAVSAPDRLPWLLFYVGLFVVLLVVIGGKQGLRGFISLVAGLLVIGYVLLPALLAGYSPVLMAVAVASLLVIVGSYITHGFNRTTTAAVVGMVITIVLTGVLAYMAVHTTELTGFNSEEATYLNFDTSGSINFVGLLLGGLLIGFLGVLYDAAIGQAVAVEELVRAAAHYSRRELFQRGMRIGREHIGALVNILAIAYVGASLPLLLLLKLTSAQSLAITVNSELFATEIVRIIVGSVGLIVAVPITTLVAVYMLHGRATPGAVHSHSH